MYEKLLKVLKLPVYMFNNLYGRIIMGLLKDDSTYLDVINEHPMLPIYQAIEVSKENK